MTGAIVFFLVRAMRASRNNTNACDSMMLLIGRMSEMASSDVYVQQDDKGEYSDGTYRRPKSSVPYRTDYS
eukprot:CAMPEP_0178749268 /NCGR_PEP_ID=MMETSP0744-20121128/9318_1 /TAXON_ID=913974 /ORGANISM="Nitzschia punctata, Strain CCMP561" /LENGTH=70 /DNA_ID=CAMNT_0020402667 /DNA_START=232 /DNA_END=444 /DNA_ORIENTATION=+